MFFFDMKQIMQKFVDVCKMFLKIIEKIYRYIALAISCKILPVLASLLATTQLQSPCSLILRLRFSCPWFLLHPQSAPKPPHYHLPPQ